MAQAQKQAANVFDKAILVQLDMKRFGNSRTIKGDEGELKANADRDTYKSSKVLVDSEEYQAITLVDNRIKHWLRERCLPSVIRKGVYILPKASVIEVENQLNTFKLERDANIAAFAAVYPSLVVTAKSRQKDIFNINDYIGMRLDSRTKEPVAIPGYNDMLRAQFSLDWYYVDFKPSESLKDVNNKLFEATKAKLEARFQTASNEIQNLMRVQMLELVGGLNERLTPSEDGKEKVLRSNKLAGVTEWLNEFDVKNLADDKQLAAVVKKAQKLLNGVDTTKIKNDAALKDSLQEQFGKIGEQLSTMIVNKPKRGMSFDDVV